MSTPPEQDPFNPSSWPKSTPDQNQPQPINPNQGPPNYNQQAPPNYNQQVPPNYNQQVPPGGYQQQYVPPGGYHPYGMNPNGQIDHPSASSINTTGIIGLICTFLVAIVGLILNIITISKSSSALRDVRNMPGRFTESSISKIRAGRTCSIIGLSIHGLLIVILILVIAANA